MHTYIHIYIYKCTHTYTYILLSILIEFIPWKWMPLQERNTDLRTYIPRAPNIWRATQSDFGTASRLDTEIIDITLKICRNPRTAPHEPAPDLNLQNKNSIHNPTPKFTAGNSPLFVRGPRRPRLWSTSSKTAPNYETPRGSYWPSEATSRNEDLPSHTGTTENTESVRIRKQTCIHT